MSSVQVCCPFCDEPNAACAARCGHCAEPLARVCGHCGLFVAAELDFCPPCGHGEWMPLPESYLPSNDWRPKGAWGRRRIAE